ncbi:hypothetical protein B0T24DRAFT_592698 [Lasiosphaeria ovina]|uniref:Uncharacterized protein n=1 Tax=Lasiosphaeria ovina TaxID=92902 RepID=A0AAE0NAR7_9PEZI|nr:hypothetical protein B0T24DRAFT_592698 [Lasiosphaeria ovina]
MAPLLQSQRDLAFAPLSQPSSRRAVAARAASMLRTLLAARDDECHPVDGGNPCEKSASASQGTTWAIVGTVVRKKRDAKEDSQDRFRMEDYGVEVAPSSRSKARADPPMRSLDESTSTDGRTPTKPTAAAQKGYLNPFVTDADDTASYQSSEGPNHQGGLAPQWPRTGESSPTRPKT